MTSRADELLQEINDEDLDLDSYDPTMVDDILNEAEEDVPEILHQDPLKFLIIPKASFQQTRASFQQVESGEDSLDEKLQLENLLLSEQLDIHTTAENVDPLDLIHKKELEDSVTTDKPFTKSLDLKRQYTKSKLPVIRFDEISNISAKIIASTGYNPGLPTALAASKDWIIIGTSYGNMMSFNHDGVELKQMKTKNNSFGSVSCIDISPDNTYVVTGYQLGQVALWEIKTGNCLKSSNTLHSSAVLSIKFWNFDKCSIVSSDASGKVMISEYVISIFSIALNTKVLIPAGQGISLSIEPLFPFEL